MYILKGKMKPIHRVRNYSLANYIQRTICFLHITAVILHGGAELLQAFKTPEPSVRHTTILTSRYMLRCASGCSLAKQSSLPETTLLTVSQDRQHLPGCTSPYWLYFRKNLWTKGLFRFIEDTCWKGQLEKQHATNKNQGEDHDS